MLTVTNDFRTAAAANYRDPRARIKVSWNDSGSDRSVVVASNDVNRGAIIDQVADSYRTTSQKWAYLGTGSGTDELIADGSFHVMPSDLVTGQVGWFSTTASDSSGEWVVDPYITLTFNDTAFTSEIINIQCDTKFNEYPVDFTIKLYNGVTLLHTEAVTGNTDTSIEVDLTSYTYNTVNKLELTIHEWSAPYGIVKINEVTFSSDKIYRGSDIVSLDILEEMEVESGSLPIGNISSNEINLTLLNENDTYTYGNTNSTYHNLIKRGRKIEVWLGFVLPTGSTDISSGIYIVETIDSKKVGFYPYGVYYSDEWITDRRSLTVKTFARDMMENLRKATYDDSDLFEDITLYDLAETVMNSASVKISGNLTWKINSNLNNTTIPYAYFERVSYFQAIKDIVSIAGATAYADRTGKIIIGEPLT